MAAGSLQTRLRALLAGCAGISSVETALVLPMLAVMVAGMSDVAMGVSAKLKLQQAAARTTEMATAAGVDSTAFDGLQGEAATSAGVPTANVTVDKWLECAGVRQANFDDSCSSGQQVARFVAISISSSYRPMFPLLGAANANGIALNGYSSVRVQ